MTEIKKSESINELAKALSQAQGQLENPLKDSTNPHFKSKYADLAGVINSIKPVLTPNGLSVSQHPSFSGNLVSVETMLMHSSGQWISSTISVPILKLDSQGVGSAITYCRRYSLAAVFGVAQEDDDGHEASVKRKPLVDEAPDTWIPKKMADRSNVLNQFAGVPINQISLDDLQKISEIAQSMIKDATTPAGKQMAENVIKLCMTEIMCRPDDKGFV